MPSTSIDNSSSRSLKRFATNFLSYGYSQIVTLAVQFLTVPFFLIYWGSQAYAEWLVISGALIMLGLLDFGVSHASASKATMLAARNEIIKIKATIQTSIAFTLLIITLILITTLSLSHAVDWESLLKLQSIQNTEAASILIFLSIHLSAVMLGGPINAWFITMDRAATGFFLLANRRMIDVAVTAAALSLNASPSTLALSMACAQVAMLLALTASAYWLSPWPILGLRNATWHELKDVIKPAAGHAGITIGQVLTLQGGLQILNQLCPASVVIAFSLGRTLMRLVMQIGIVSNHALRPILSRLIGSNDEGKSITLTKQIAKLTAMIGLAAYLMLIIVGPKIVFAWSAGKVNINHAELASIGLHAIINVAWFVYASHQMANNKHARISLFFLCGGVIGIAAMTQAISLGMPPLVAAGGMHAIQELFAATYLFYFWLQNTEHRHSDSIADKPLNDTLNR